jgi:DNA-binding NtrC family response regulator
MKRVTLYHQGRPIIHHTLYKEHFSIGADPSNDLVLAGGGVAERHLTISRTQTGRWQAAWGEGAGQAGNQEIKDGAKIAFGPFAVAVEQETPADAAAPCSVCGDSGRTFESLGWVGRSALMQQVRFETEILAPFTASVLVTGESGTGKELVARGLHTLSDRRDGPFAAVNCGGFTESLLEDTLFGHERGAFTGASGARRGIFQQADKGTLFLDEIGDLPLSCQAALLRVLDEKRVSRIGKEGSDEVDFRLVAATNRDLKEMIKKKTFRLDLYHRISTLSIRTFALREHTEDIEDIAARFFSQTKTELGPRSLDRSALDKMSGYEWPGNVRELRNVLFRSAALSPKAVLCADDIDIPSIPRQKNQLRLAKLSANHLASVLAGHNGNIAAAARTLGVPRTSLRDRIKADHIDELKSVELAV